MKINIKKIPYILFDFFILLSIVTFIISTYHMLLNTLTDFSAMLFSTFGVCFLIVNITYKYSNRIFERILEAIQLNTKYSHKEN